jgi:hypothetical protein
MREIIISSWHIDARLILSYLSSRVTLTSFLLCPIRILLRLSSLEINYISVLGTCYIGRMSNGFGYGDGHVADVLISTDVDVG